MHTRRQTQLSSLSLVLPHPPLPKRTSSIRSSNDSFPSPRTPRTSIGLASPSLLKLADSAVSRRSTDSWNSSVHENGDDDMEWEWTTEQVALLSKTLDALPSHLLSPFNGSIPPANVLDKISRGIIHAKDSKEWPHSIRSTRIKLLKLARGRAEESRHSLELNPDVLQPTTNVPKKPLYRQSSMDFLKGNTLKNEKNIDRLSTRLQRIDRVIPNPAYAYDRNSSRTPSPPPAQRRPLSMGEPPRTPRTPTSDGIAFHGPPSSLSSSRGSKLRRSTTALALSGLPTIPSGVASDCISGDKAGISRVPKVKRSESFSSPHLNGLGHSLKRAPSYGSVSSRMSIDDQKENSPQFAAANPELDIYPSSDDEEKRRNHKTKKQKTAGESPAKKPNALTKTSSEATIKSSGISTPKKDVRTRKQSAKKIAYTQNVFGAALPNPQPERTPPSAHMALPNPSPELLFMLPDENMEVQPATPNRRLRRVKTANFPPRMKRRISFGHLSAPAEGGESGHSGSGLGSAFQLR